MSGNITWVQLRSLDGHHCLRARVERMGARRARTLSIEGAIRNLKLPYPPPRGVQERTPFDHRGHLIAARFGGPSRRQAEEDSAEVADELLAHVPPEQRLEGLPPEQRLAGLDVEQAILALSALTPRPSSC